MGVPAPDSEPEASLLVIDDKRDTREAMVAYLEFEGFQVRQADSGELGLSLVAERIPDMVLLDGMMPGMDGLEVLAALRSRPETAHIPVIMVTARGDTSDVARALHGGADDYLIKPVQLELLVSRVRTLLRLRRLEARQGRIAAQLKRLNLLTDLAMQVLAMEGSEPVQRAADEMRALMADLLSEEDKPAGPPPAQG